MNTDKIGERRQDVEWIPVTERLPKSEDTECILCIRSVEHYGRGKNKAHTYWDIQSGFYDGSDWYTDWYHGCHRVADENEKYKNGLGEQGEVVAWMPSPKPWNPTTDKLIKDWNNNDPIEEDSNETG